MKTKLILSCACAIYSISLFSQSISLGIAGGYNAPIASTFTTVDVQQIYTSSGYESQKVIRRSYGQGGNVAFDFNWFSKKDIGFGVKLNAHIGSPAASTAELIDPYGSTLQYNFKDKPFSAQFIPHLSFKHDFKKVTPVFELGMIVGLTQVVEDYQISDNMGNIERSTINHHGGVMLGFYSSLGVECHVSKVVRITLALTCSAASYSPTKWDRTSITENGQNVMSQLSTSDLHGVYVKEINSTTPQPSSSPQQDLKYAIPFSNVGFNVGIAFVLVKKKVRMSQQASDKDKDNTKVLHPF